MNHYLNKLISICILFFIPASVFSKPKDILLESSYPQKPSWADSTIIEKREFIFSVGHSKAQPTEDEAKDQALARATEEVVRYSGVTVEIFDRINESSSVVQGDEFYRSDFEARSRIRARAFVRRAVPADWYIRKMTDKKMKEVYYLASILLRVPREEIMRIHAEKDIKLSIDIGVYYEDEQGRLQYLNEGRVLHSGDGYALYVRSSDPCYLYMYQIDDLNRTFRLFPNKAYKTGSNPLNAGQYYWVPGDTGRVLWLDDTVGKEKIYIFASAEAIPELEGTTTFEEAQERVLNLMGPRPELKEKLISYSVAKPIKQVYAAEVKKKLQAGGAFVWEMWFWHR